MGPGWDIELLGGLRARRGERTVERFPTQKTAALFAYLAYHQRRAHPRESLVDMLWPEAASAAGRNSLSKALSALRQSFEAPATDGVPVFAADRYSVGVHRDSLAIDAAAYESCLADARLACDAAEKVDGLAKAVGLYRGDLLPGFYEDWVLHERDRLRSAQHEALRELAGCLAECDRIPEALDVAHRAVQLDPLDESAQRTMIRLLGQSGHKAAALRQYASLEQLLADELGVEPEPETTQLLEALGTTTDTALPPLPVAKAGPAGITGVSGTVTFMAAHGGSTEVDWSRAESAALRLSVAEVVEEEVLLAAFERAGDAIDAAADVVLRQDQEQGASHGMRAALHTTEVAVVAPHEWRDTPWGRRLSRTLGATQAGRVVCSISTASLVRRHLDPELALVDLGRYRLASGARAMRLFELLHARVSGEARPRLDLAPVQDAQLPRTYTRMFGRDADVADVVSRLRGGSRLLTVTGGPGIGKTRLALAVADELVLHDGYDARFVDLSGVHEPSQVPSLVAEALGAAPVAADPVEQLRSLRLPDRSLVVLDSCEHLLPAGAREVQQLLEATPMQLVATSRTSLHLNAEQVVMVGPLPVPDVGDATPSDSVPSVAMFADRARHARSDFDLSGHRHDVAELCRRLEGIPLAIELAAARLPVLTPREMVERTDDRLALLTGRRGVDEAGRTLREAIAWSFDLLDERRKRLIACLGVFRGGWTLEAAEAVVKDPLALDIIEELIDASIVWSIETGAVMRFQTFGAVREFAWDLLPDSDRKMVQAHHAVHFASLAETGAAELRGARQAEWLDRLEADRHNFHAAMDWCARSDQDLGLRIAGALWRYWYVRGPVGVGRREIERMISAAGEDADAEALALALHGAATIATRMADYEAAEVGHRKALELRRSLGDEGGVAASLNNLAVISYDQLKMGDSKELWEQSLAIKRRLGDDVGIATTLHNLATIAMVYDGEFAAARRMLDESLSLRQSRGDDHGVAEVLSLLGFLHACIGSPKASDKFREAEEAHRRLGNDYGLAYAKRLWGSHLLEVGAYDDAAVKLTESLAISRELADTVLVVQTLTELAVLRVAQGDQALSQELIDESRREAGDISGRPEPAGAIAYAEAWRTVQNDQSPDATRQVRRCLVAALETEDLDKVLRSLLVAGVVAARSGQRRLAVDIAKALAAAEQCIGLHLGVAQYSLFRSAMSSEGLAEHLDVTAPCPDRKREAVESLYAVAREALRVIGGGGTAS